MFSKLKEKAKQLKSQAIVLAIAYKDRRTPLIAKILIAVTIAYLISPIDLIPDFIPILGLLDDILLVPALIAVSIKLIPKQVISDAKLKAQTETTFSKKNKWYFAIVIICVWLLALYFVIKLILRKTTPDVAG